MLRHATLSLLLVAVVGGCHVFGGGSNEDDDILRPSGVDSFLLSDEEDATQDENDEWAFVGNEARGNKMLERDPDPWWQTYFMSPKARNIERNLGIAGPDE